MEYIICSHCWHRVQSAILKVVREGFVEQKCCRCGKRREVHVAHITTK